MSVTLPGYLHCAQTTTQITDYMKTVEDTQIVVESHFLPLIYSWKYDSSMQGYA